MTREELIHMAREASASMLHGGEYALFGNTAIERFAALARADEREECAKICDEAAIRLLSNGKARVNEVDRHTAQVLRDKAKAIRARGQA